MRAGGLNLGGEQSGHMTADLLDHRRRSDRRGCKCSPAQALRASGDELWHRFEPVPQLLKNVGYSGGDPLNAAPVKAAIAEARGALGHTGRLVIRKSGTEPMIRVMAEGDDPKLVETVVNDIVGAISKSRHAA